MRLLNEHGQSTAEYAVVIAVVLGAAVGMQAFMKRGVQAKVKTAATSLGNVTGKGDFADFGKMEQYEPYYAEQDMKTFRDDETDEEYKADGAIARTNVAGKAMQSVTHRVNSFSKEHGNATGDKTAYKGKWE